MRRLAIMVAVMSFFALAIVGSLYEVPPFACAIRALVGAVVAFVLTNIVARVFLSIMVDTVVKNSSSKNKAEDIVRES